MIKQEDNAKPITIKTEPGTSAGPVMQRLPSLRPPRDLSLSAYSQKIPNLNAAKNKKVYIPNLNVQRNKPSETVTVKTEPVKSNQPEKLERTRGRGRRNLVQLGQGLFAEGVPGQKNAGRGSYSGGGGEDKADVLRRPTLKLKENIKVDKKEEEETIKHLLRDDFIDDLSIEPDFDHCPITLPLLNCKDDPGLRKKCDIKPVDKKEHITVNDVFSNTTVPDPGFIFFQLPSSMPGLSSEPQPEVPKNKAQATSSASQSTEAKKPESERCLLSNLPAGQIGKLQILKSGRARLVFGDIMMWLEMGTQVAYRQDVMSISLDKETHTGHTVNLGPINARMVATPDWEGMLANIKVEKQTQST